MKDIDFSKKMDVMVDDIHQSYTRMYTDFIIQMMDSLSLTQIWFYYVECNLNDKNVLLHYLDSTKDNDLIYKLKLGYFDNLGCHNTIDFSELSLSDMEYIVRIVVDYTNRMKEARKTKETIKVSSEFEINIPKKDALTIDDAIEWIDKHWSRLVEQNKREIINNTIHQLTSKEEDI